MDFKAAEQYTGWDNTVEFYWRVWNGFEIISSDELIELIKDSSLKDKTSQDLINFLNKGPMLRYEKFIGSKKLIKKILNHYENKITFKSGKHFSTYNPLKNDKLFSSFNSINANNDNSILNWVNKYGLPGYIYEYDNFTTEEHHNLFMKLWRYAIIEPLSEMKALITDFQHIFSVYNLVSRKKITELKNLVHEAGKDNWMKISNLHFSIEERAGINTESNRFLNEKYSHKYEIKEGIIKAALIYINENIEYHLKEKIIPTFNDIQVDQSGNWSVSQAWECTDLIAAIYLQFYWVIIKNKPIKRCMFCKETMPPKRNTKKFCSVNCRRKVHSRILKILRNDKTISEVAKEDDRAETEIVSWIEDYNPSKKENKKLLKKFKKDNDL